MASVETYILTQDFNFFGNTIEKGTVYKQSSVNRDNYNCCTPDGAWKPYLDLTFHTVRNNPEYFLKASLVAMSVAVSVYKMQQKEDAYDVNADGSVAMSTLKQA